MNAASSLYSPPQGDCLGRVARLTLKELRETLRDRRTIVTLVLMPLLVYPLLSLGFKQFLLASLTTTDLAGWRIAAESDQHKVLVGTLLAQGDRLLRREQNPGAEPSRRRQAAAPAPADSNERPGAAPAGEFVVEAFPGAEMEHAVLSGEFDLGVRLQAMPTVAAGRPVGSYDFELIYAARSVSGPTAAKYVEERLRAVNDAYLTNRLRQLGDSGDVPAVWQTRSVGEAEQTHFQLATLVPMVLILMTITGAVYPAIDLTAGERERGTLEALMAAPVPRLGLLFAKYVAVVTVALLTALVNIVGMVITVLSSGLAPTLFGERGLTVGAVVLVFLLLVLFAAFFSAVLLCVTSFARSFKEAQAYLIPLMLLSLAPGFLTVMPDTRLNGWMSVAPLANIVLLARDTLSGTAQPLWGFIAVLTTALYGTAALGLAARIFGSDSILYGSQSSWSDLVRRPAQPLAQPTLAGAMFTLALIVPLFVILSSALTQMTAWTPSAQLIASAAMLAILFGLLPAMLARFQGVALSSGFQLQRPPLLGLLGAVVLGTALAPLAFELILVSRQWGIGTLSDAELVEKGPLVERLASQWQGLPPLLVLSAIALAPAACEELFFRGYFLSALRGRMPGWLAIVFTGMIFGLFHASFGGIIVVERVLSSMVLGIVLGWVCLSTGSVLPGMLTHALVNSFVVALVYWGDALKQLNWDLKDRQHIPIEWLAGASLLAAAGAALVLLSQRLAVSPPLAASPLVAETPPP